MINEKKRKKTGGRRLGTPNKATKMQREFIQDILDNQTDRIQVELSRLKGVEYLKVIISLFEFTMPKLGRTEIANIPPSQRTTFVLPNGRSIEI